MISRMWASDPASAQRSSPCKTAGLPEQCPIRLVTASWSAGPSRTTGNAPSSRRWSITATRISALTHLCRLPLPGWKRTSGWSVRTPLSCRQACPRFSRWSGNARGAGGRESSAGSRSTSTNRSLWCPERSSGENGDCTRRSCAPAPWSTAARVPASSCIQATARSHRPNQSLSSPVAAAGWANNSPQARPPTDSQASISRHSSNNGATCPLAQRTSWWRGKRARSRLMPGTASRTSPSAPGWMMTIVRLICQSGRTGIGSPRAQYPGCLKIRRRIDVQKRPSVRVDCAQFSLRDESHLERRMRDHLLNLQVMGFDHLFHDRETSPAIERVHRL